MTDAEQQIPVATGTLVAVGAATAMTAAGFTQGWWWPNVHSGLLAISFAFLGAYVLHERRGHPLGAGFLVTGLVHGVMFTGRQFGRNATTPAGRWLAWVGVWPIAVSLAAVTACVLLYPDGRLPGRRWRPVAAAVVAVAMACSAMSALWPVEYESAHVTAEPLFRLPGASAADTVWSAIAHPAYAVMQSLWVVALVWRWRRSHGAIRRQVLWLIAAAGGSVVALLVGLAVSRSPRAGVLSAALLPVVAGWSIVHGQQVSARQAFGWLSRAHRSDVGLPTGLCEAAAHSLGASAAELWIGGPAELSAIGRWPDAGDFPEPTALDVLLDDRRLQVREVRCAGGLLGALTVARPDSEPLSRSEAALFDDLASHASLVIENLSFARVVERERAAGHLVELTVRENQVLELMSRGLSNAAICDELNLSIKTVEPAIGAVFMKLGLHADAGSNRRVLAVLAYLRQQH